MARQHSYIFTDGFRFPFGDYFDMTIDDRGKLLRLAGRRVRLADAGFGLVHAPAKVMVAQPRLELRTLNLVEPKEGTGLMSLSLTQLNQTTIASSEKGHRFFGPVPFRKFRFTSRPFCTNRI